MRTTVSILFFLLIVGCKEQKKDAITIAAAANMQFAIQEISEEFTKQTGIETELILSSSGKLTAQIKEGAPYDIFVAANMKYPKVLYQSRLTVAPPKIYAHGQLVLWSLYEDIIPSLEMLADTSITHIAIANPRTAPYGEAALEVLANKDIFDVVKSKLVYGESISQTNQFIVSKSAELGFTAKSVVLSTRMKGRGHWVLLDKNMYTPIHQGVVLIKKKSRNIEKAQQFYDFLFSTEAQEILEDFGYLVAQ